MEDLLRFDTIHLMIPAAAGLVIAIILLVLRKKKNGVRPKYARPFLIIALILIVFAIITLVVIPVVGYGYLFLKFGTGIFYSGLKS